MKTLIASALILASSASFAHDTSFSSDACNVDLKGGINIDAKEITFSKNKVSVYTVTPQGELFLQGNPIELTANQQALLNDYSLRIRAVVPEVKAIALDAIDLAIDGVNLAFNELLGEGNDVSADLTEQLTGIRGDVDAEFASQKSFYIDENGFSGEDFFSDDFEQRIESAVESTVQNSLGSLMIAVGQELLFSGGDMDTFETKMERFGEQIELEMETRSEGIAKRGDALCQSIITIDAMEEQLRNSIDEIAEFNFISISENTKHSEI